VEVAWQLNYETRLNLGHLADRVIMPYAGKRISFQTGNRKGILGDAISFGT